MRRLWIVWGFSKSVYGAVGVTVLGLLVPYWTSYTQNLFFLFGLHVFRLFLGYLLYMHAFHVLAIRVDYLQVSMTVSCICIRDHDMNSFPEVVKYIQKNICLVSLLFRLQILVALYCLPRRTSPKSGTLYAYHSQASSSSSLCPW